MCGSGQLENIQEKFWPTADSTFMMMLIWILLLYSYAPFLSRFFIILISGCEAAKLESEVSGKNVALRH